MGCNFLFINFYFSEVAGDNRGLVFLIFETLATSLTEVHANVVGALATCANQCTGNISLSSGAIGILGVTGDAEVSRVVGADQWCWTICDGRCANGYGLWSFCVVASCADLQGEGASPVKSRVNFLENRDPLGVSTE